MSVDYHVKRRDAYQMLADAEQEQIEQMEPKEIEIPKPTEQEFNGLPWEIKSSEQGKPYEQVKNDDTKAFRRLQNWLSENKGFAQLYNYKIWSHMNDENTIDRRKR